jgi:hypothetical protein
MPGEYDEIIAAIMNNQGLMQDRPEDISGPPIPHPENLFNNIPTQPPRPRSLLHRVHPNEPKDDTATELQKYMNDQKTYDERNAAGIDTMRPQHRNDGGRNFMDELEAPPPDAPSGNVVRDQFNNLPPPDPSNTRYPMTVMPPQEMMQLMQFYQNNGGDI